MLLAAVLVQALVIAAYLAGCAATNAGRDLRGESGPVAWEVVDVRQSREENAARMRWDYTLVLRNRGASAIAFERVDVGSQAVGTVDVWGGMSSQAFTHRLKPDGEIRLSRSDTWGCPHCDASHLRHLLRSGFIRFLTFTGRDERGAGVKVSIRVRLDSSVGAR
jgi:hypothetical protein